MAMVGFEFVGGFFYRSCKFQGMSPSLLADNIKNEENTKEFISVKEFVCLIDIIDNADLHEL